MQVGVEQRAFTGRKFDAQDHDGIILQHEMVMGFIFNGNRRLLRRE
jgi:hypothetical protein